MSNTFQHRDHHKPGQQSRNTPESRLEQVLTGHADCPPIHRGDHIRYRPEHKEKALTGRVIDFITEPKHGGPPVIASPDDPLVVIKDDHSHKQAAYRPDIIIGKVPEGAHGIRIEDYVSRETE
ncbi:hypothetical protein GGF31_006020 [Allomyces arbusculus]|nr:hypothetical protein GGF31_006020 [Allomyces arbusculus]